jgi:hypothetical protein
VGRNARAGSIPAWGTKPLMQMRGFFYVSSGKSCSCKLASIKKAQQQTKFVVVKALGKTNLLGRRFEQSEKRQSRAYFFCSYVNRILVPEHL